VNKLIKLVDHSFKWYKKDNISVIGYAFNKEEYLNDEELAYYIKVNLDRYKDLNKILTELNGFFSIVIESSENIYLCCDRTRSFPLFYYIDHEGIRISNFTKEIVGEKIELDSEAVEEFKYTSFVTGGDTLIKNLKAVQAGEFITINKYNYEVLKNTYYEFAHKEYLDIHKVELIKTIHEKYMGAFKRLIRSVEGRTIVIPLSGGYDSRLIVQMLYLLNYKNIICFSYGKLGNKESLISKKVAEHFGFKWIFIEYTDSKLKGMYEDIDKCENFASNYVSVIHLQDYIAIKEMKENSLIPDDSVIVPGHSGDFIAGSHIKQCLTKNMKNHNTINNEIIKSHYNLFKIRNCKSIKARVNKNYKVIGANSIKNNISHFEKFDWRERQCKFIINSVRMYELFNFQWRIPLWDFELIDYWCEIDYRYRINRNLYIEYANGLELEQGLHLNQNNVISERSCDIGVAIKEKIKESFLGGILRFIKFIISYDKKEFGFNNLMRRHTFIKKGIMGAINDNSIFAEEYLLKVLKRIRSK